MYILHSRFSLVGGLADYRDICVCVCVWLDFHISCVQCTLGTTKIVITAYVLDMVWCQFLKGAKQLFEPNLTCCQLNLQREWTLNKNMKVFTSKCNAYVCFRYHLSIKILTYRKLYWDWYGNITLVMETHHQQWKGLRIAWCQQAWRRQRISHCSSDLILLGVVSLTFRKLSKIISRKYTVPEITFMVRISSRNFVSMPKAWLWAHVQSFGLKF